VDPEERAVDAAEAERADQIDVAHHDRHRGNGPTPAIHGSAPSLPARRFGSPEAP
jgi:hypothetical protein